MTCPCFPRPIGRDLRGSSYTRFRHSELNCHVFQKKYLYICCPLIKITSGNLKSGVNFGNMLIYEDEKRENEISCLSIIFSVISSSEFGVLGNLLLLLRNKTVKILIPDTDAKFILRWETEGLWEIEGTRVRFQERIIRGWEGGWNPIRVPTRRAFALCPAYVSCAFRTSTLPNLLLSSKS